MRDSSTLWTWVTSTGLTSREMVIPAATTYCFSQTAVTCASAELSKRLAWAAAIRPFWAAMLQNKRFRCHIRFMLEHWLTEQARGTRQSDWPPVAAGKWVAADRHARLDRARDGFEEAAPDSIRDGKCKAFMLSRGAVRRSKRYSSWS